MFGVAHESKTYGVKYQARSIAAVVGEPHHTQFLVGTLSLREENEVHLIQLADDGSDISCEGLFAHPNEIWDIAACPSDATLFSTVHASAGESYASIWRMPSRFGGGGTRLELAGQLTGVDAQFKSVLWSPHPDSRQLVSLDEESLRIWELSSAGVKPLASAAAGQLEQLSCGSWDPHSPNGFATAGETNLSLWDLRSMRKQSSIEGAHQLQIRDIDFNPRQQHVVMTAGDDSRIRVWDTRKPRAALVELPGHSHWVWCARFNKFYDDLVISCGTDSTVNLWLVPSACSRANNSRSIPTAVAPPLKHPSSSSFSAAASSRPSLAGTPKSPHGPLDELALSLSDFEDSVYGVAWSAIDPWVFASLSHDGRVVLDVVPDYIRTKCRR